MEDPGPAPLLPLLAAGGLGVRLPLAPPKPSRPEDVQPVPLVIPPPGALSAPARKAARLARPLLPGERVDLDRADVTEITRLPRIGPAFAQRIVAWRERHGPFGNLARFDSVPGVGPKLLESLESYVMFSGALP